MKLAEKIEHLEYTAKEVFNIPFWKQLSHSRKWMKKMQHKAWRRWSKRNLDENSNSPMYNRYSGWEY